MRIDRLLDSGTPTFSFEFFPPKTEQGERNLEAALAEHRSQLLDRRPDAGQVGHGL